MYSLIKKLANAPVLRVRTPIPAALLEKSMDGQLDSFDIISSSLSRFLLLIIAVALVIGIGLKNTTKTCFYCGRVICDQCLAESRMEGVCNPCYQVFLSGKSVDPRLKIEQKGLVRTYHRLMGAIGLALSILIPGSGLILEEHVIPGLALVIWPIAFIALQFAGELIPAPLIPVFIALPALTWIGLFVYLVFSLISTILYLALARVET